MARATYGVMSSMPLHFMEDVSHLVLLRAKIADVRLPRGDFDRHALDDFEPVALDPDDLARVIRDQADIAETEVDENLGADPVVAKVRFEAELEVRLHGIAPIVLQLIGFDLVQQTNAAPFLIEVQQHPAALLLDHLQRAVELVATVAAQ